MKTLKSFLKNVILASQACYSSSETIYLPFFWGVHHICLQFLIYKFSEDLFSIMPTNTVKTILVSIKDVWM